MVFQSAQSHFFCLAFLNTFWAMQKVFAQPALGADIKKMNYNLKYPIFAQGYRL
jgi:hypothetical protein